MSDMLGNVAELANSNVFMVKDGVVLTPAPNGTFLDGITRQRAIQLLRDAGEQVVETTLRYADFQDADEIFSTGNFAKLSAITRIDERAAAAGAGVPEGRELYRAFADATASSRGPTREDHGHRRADSACAPDTGVGESADGPR